MIDWPNALTGFCFGVVTTLMFWIPDRIRAIRQRHAELWESWKVAMKEIELLTWKPETRNRDIYIARTRYPIDLWRTVLKEREGFHLLEQLEMAYSTVEHFAEKRSIKPPTASYLEFEQAETFWNDSRIAFANYSRGAQSKGYSELVQREQRRQFRRDFLRNPIRAVRESRSRAKQLKTFAAEYRSAGIS